MAATNTAATTTTTTDTMEITANNYGNNDDTDLSELTVFQENYALLCNTITDITDPLMNYFVEEQLLTTEEENATTLEKLRFLLIKISSLLKAKNTRSFYMMLRIMKEQGGKGTETLADHIMNRLNFLADEHDVHLEHDGSKDKIKVLAEKVIAWCHEKRRKINQRKCVGILHAQFTNGQEIYITALSGTGYKIEVESTGGVNLQIASYNIVWERLRSHLEQLQLQECVIVAKFDAVHKACLTKYENKIITDQAFFKMWIDRLKSWIGKWHEHYEKMLKMNKKFTIKWLVEQGMKDTYLEQMKVEAPSEFEALQRFNDIVDFLTDCIPEYQPGSDKLPLRMKIQEMLFTKTAYEIKKWFDNELTTKLSQYKTDFVKLCKKFNTLYHIFLICWDVSCSCYYLNIDFRVKFCWISTRGGDLYMSARNIEQFQDCFGYWQKIGELLWAQYKREYDETYRLPKGYTTVSMIWGGILKGGFKYTAGIANFFIQCAEDNALCTLVDYVSDNQLKCQKVSWYAFQYKNKCQEGKCKDPDCEHDKCKGKDFKCYNIEHKPLCAFCEQTFGYRVCKALNIEKQDIYIEGGRPSSDSDEDNEDFILSSI